MRRSRVILAAATGWTLCRARRTARAGSNPKPELVLFQDLRPQGAALWAKHSEDSAGLQINVDQETARAQAAEAALQAAIQAEAQARLSGDAGLAAALAAEIIARQAGDAN